MKFLYSLWTKPKQHYYEEIKMLHCSIKLLNSISSNIDIVTDDKGFNLINNIGILNLLKINNVRKDLNSLENMDIDLWACPKIYSLSLYNEPVCHIDLDFMIKNPKDLKNLLENQWDIIVQSKESGYHFNYFYRESINCFLMCLLNQNLNFIDDFPEFLYKEGVAFSYNCGFLGFKNLIAKENYTKKSLNIFNMFNQNENIKKFYDLQHIICKQNHNIHRLTINCLIEQYFLSLYSNYNNLYVKEIFSLCKWETKEGIKNKWWIDGVRNRCETYIHYAGGDKEQFNKDLNLGRLLINKKDNS